MTAVGRVSGRQGAPHYNLSKDDGNIAARASFAREILKDYPRSMVEFVAEISAEARFAIRPRR